MKKKLLRAALAALGITLALGAMGAAGLLEFPAAIAAALAAEVAFREIRRRPSRWALSGFALIGALLPGRPEIPWAILGGMAFGVIFGMAWEAIREVKP